MKSLYCYSIARRIVNFSLTIIFLRLEDFHTKLLATAVGPMAKLERGLTLEIHFKVIIA